MRNKLTTKQNSNGSKIMAKHTNLQSLTWIVSSSLKKSKNLNCKCRAISQLYMNEYFPFLNQIYGIFCLLSDYSIFASNSLI